jgi:ADP-ribose pyrophosphatase YjhB (NUDIX family)
MKDAYCSHCGTAFELPQRYPRKCSNQTCKEETWSNPLPVAVILVPILRRGSREGLLMIRRGIEPGVGKLALVGGFIEAHESWQVAAARELQEETGISVPAASIRPQSFVSTEPRPDRILLFCTSSPVEASSLRRFAPTEETTERGIVYGPKGLEELLAFPLHMLAAKQYFSSRGAQGPHGYEPI